jgi:hypothetical protein
MQKRGRTMDNVLKQEMENLKGEFNKLSKKMDKVIDILSGDQEFDKSDTGMVGEMKQLKARVTKLERWKDRVIYLLIGAAFAGGWTLSDLIGKFFSK